MYSKHLLYTSNELINLTAGVFFPLIALFVLDLTGGIFSIGLAFALYYGAASLTALGTDPSASDTKETAYVICGYLLSATGFSLLLFADSLYLFFMIQILLGVGRALYSPAMDALYTESIEDENHNLGWSNWESKNYMVLALGALLGSFIVANYGFYMLFTGMAIVCLIGSVYLVFGRIQRHVEKKRGFYDIAEASDV